MNGIRRGCDVEPVAFACAGQLLKGEKRFDCSLTGPYFSYSRPKRKPKFIVLTGAKVTFSGELRKIRLYKSASALWSVFFDKTFVASSQSSFFSWKAAITRALVLWDASLNSPPVIQSDASMLAEWMNTMAFVWVHLTMATGLGFLDARDIRACAYSVRVGRIISFCGSNLLHSKMVSRKELNAILISRLAQLQRWLPTVVEEFLTIVQAQRSTTDMGTRSVRTIHAEMLNRLRDVSITYTTNVLSRSCELVSTFWNTNGTGPPELPVRDVLSMCLGCPPLAPWSDILQISQKYLSTTALTPLGLGAPDPTNPAKPGLLGIANSGNTCYLSAALQCLLHTPQLIRFFVTKCHRLYERGNHEDSLAVIVAELMTSMWLGHRTLDAGDAVRHLACVKPSNFSRGMQHDAQEVLVVMLDILDSELSFRQDKVVASPSQTFPGATTDILDEEEIISLMSTEHQTPHCSCIAHYFSGQTVQKLSCVCCGAASYCCDPFIFLFAPLPEALTEPAAAAVSLEDCLAQVFCEEMMTMTHGSKCQRCGRVERTAQRSLEIQRLPPYLLVCLSRFQQDADGHIASKNTVPVSVPERLIMGPWLRSTAALTIMEEGGNTRLNDLDKVSTERGAYELYGVVNHTGTISYGHYTANCCVGDSWWLFDDSHVSWLGSYEDWSGDSASDAYVLFYRTTALSSCLPATRK